MSKKLTKKIAKDKTKVRRARRQLVKRERQAKKKVKKSSGGIRGILGSLAQAAGTGIGTLYGQPALGSMIGGYAKKWISGSGDYVTNFDGTKSNTLMSAGPPEFNGKHGVRIKKRECLGPVTNGAVVSGSTAFTNSLHAINPGLAATFPWLSGIANQFEQYKMHGLIFEFVSEYANAVSSTNGAIGTVIMATNYNVLEPAFKNVVEAQNYSMSEIDKPTSSFLHAVECKPSEEPLKIMYVRDGELTDKEDLRFSDIGNFQIMTQGQQAQTQLGTLWISYDVEFFKPRVQASGLAAQVSAYCHNNVQTGYPLGTIDTVVQHGNLALNIVGSNNDPVLQFPQWIRSGYFLITHYTYSSSGTQAYYGGISLINCENTSVFKDFTLPVAVSGAGTSQSMIQQHTIKITGPGATVTLPGALFATGANAAMDLIVTDISSYILSMSKEEQEEKELMKMISKNFPQLMALAKLDLPPISEAPEPFVDSDDEEIEEIVSVKSKRRR